MTMPAAPPDLTVTQLGPVGRLLGDGGQARVFELPALTLPDRPGPLVYKAYRPGHAPAHGLHKIIALRRRLFADPAKLARLDATTAWPLRQVVDANGALAGIVLPRIPDSFMHELRLPFGPVERVTREVQFLFIPPDRAVRGGTPTPTPTERLVICRDFAATLAFLHDELRVAFGDINARNAVFRIGTEPTVMFVDCDAVRVVGEAAIAAQLNAPDWDPPEGRDVLGRPTDLYKLGLFVLRCLTPGQNCSINRDPDEARGVLDEHGLRLLTAAVGVNPAARPSAEEWHRYLHRVLGESLAPPSVESIVLGATMVAVGEPLTVTWAAREADTIEVSGAGASPVTVPGIVGSGTITVLPTRSGPITVTARNKLGQASGRAGPVAVFDLPSLRDLPIPMPRLNPPWATAPPLPSVGRLLPRFPMGAPVSPPPMVTASHPWALPDRYAPPGRQAPPEPIELSGPPPVFGAGPSAIPFDLSRTIADPTNDRHRPER